MKKALGLFSFTILHCVIANAQIGNEFWFAAPDISSEHYTILL